MQLGGKNFGGMGGRANALSALPLSPPTAPSNLQNGRLFREQSGKFSHAWDTVSGPAQVEGLWGPGPPPALFEK